MVRLTFIVKSYVKVSHIMSSEFWTLLSSDDVRTISSDSQKAHDLLADHTQYTDVKLILQFANVLVLRKS